MSRHPADLLCRLGLTALVREHEVAITRADADNWGYCRLLHHVIETETNELTRRIGLLKESGLPTNETLARLALCPRCAVTWSKTIR